MAISGSAEVKWFPVPELLDSLLLYEPPAAHIVSVEKVLLLKNVLGFATLCHAKAHPSVECRLPSPLGCFLSLK